MNALETHTVRGLTVKIFQDDDPFNPRVDWDILGTIIEDSRSRNWVGDERMDAEQAQEIVNDPDNFCLPVYLFSHSGLSVSTGTSSFSAADSQGFDWGLHGFIYVAKAKAMKEFDVGEWNADFEAKIKRILEGEVNTLDQLLRGDVYRYTITDEDGVVLESCGGFFGDINEDGVYDPYATIRAEAVSTAEYFNSERLPPMQEWAAIAADKIAGKFALNGYAEQVRDALTAALRAAPEQCAALVGTPIAPADALKGWTPPNE